MCIYVCIYIYTCINLHIGIAVIGECIYYLFKSLLNNICKYIFTYMNKYNMCV